jgi:hypothetical protein
VGPGFDAKSVAEQRVETATGDRLGSHPVLDSGETPSREATALRPITLGLVVETGHGFLHLFDR